MCERGFKKLAFQQNHFNTDTGMKPHRCKNCETMFTTSGELMQHMRYKHAHEKPLRNPDCDYTSVERSKLKNHLRIHTGEKPYKCNICNARFTQNNGLKAHRRIHTGDKLVY